MLTEKTKESMFLNFLIEIGWEVQKECSIRVATKQDEKARTNKLELKVSCRPFR